MPLLLAVQYIALKFVHFQQMQSEQQFLTLVDLSTDAKTLYGMDETQNAPSLSQAQRMKKLAQEGKLTYEAAFAIMGEAKKDELDKVVIKNDTLKKYFPRSYTPRQMEDVIIKLLEQWQRRQQRQNER